MFNLYSRKQNELKDKISQYHTLDEKECVSQLLANVKLEQSVDVAAKEMARNLIKSVRKKRVRGGGVDALMQEFKLSTNEGVALMCLSESLLRIPDKKTQNLLIRDKITKGNWSEHLRSRNIFANAASWGLLLTGKLTASYDHEDLVSTVLKVIAKSGEPIIRKSMSLVVRILGHQFVMGETIDDALNKAPKKEDLGYKFSYDMLGEAAMNDHDAQKYLQSYVEAITKVGEYAKNSGVHNSPGISVKLSAIHPRYERAQITRVMDELLPRLKDLYLLAKSYGIGLFIDAEESERLEISLELLEKLVSDPDLQGFTGIGFVIQAYQKRAPYVIEFVANLAKQYQTKIMVRLVKGAYWDSEIKQSQVDGLDGYPVYTRKFYTDLAYIYCCQKLFGYNDVIYPLFATHNAYTMALVYQLGQGKEYEFQCLFGMGETLYNKVVGAKNLGVSCRVYAPVGSYETLLAYLIRRLLENGANSSFIHQIVDKSINVDDLLVSPIELATKTLGAANPHISLPRAIYPNDRLNSAGINLASELTLSQLQLHLQEMNGSQIVAHSLIPGYKYQDSDKLAVLNPADHQDTVGYYVKAQGADVTMAITNALNAHEKWATQTFGARADILLKMADLLERDYIQFLNILVREAGKTFANAINEVREAIDFCRYYAMIAKTKLDDNQHKPLGVIACISPWNFPLAIFLGEVSSALVAGNCVIAKPSMQTNLVAFKAIQLLHEAGVDSSVVQLLIGSGATLGEALTVDQRIDGVVFTGSTEVAKNINRNLAKKEFEAVLIAETGGQNVMIVDSSALPEQVVQDVITSGFDSAGQRCSALRVLYLQEEIADKVLDMLIGAMDELKIGKPMDIATDVGPVIDAKAQQGLLEHIAKIKVNAKLFHQTKLTDECSAGTFVAPTLIEIDDITKLEHEVFGPVVHVIRFKGSKLESVIKAINSTGYGLTQGVHSRIAKTTQMVYNQVNAGNIYVNRNMVGAVVGVQPFGGEGLSGTGPKAGGPLYLYRLVKSAIHPTLGSNSQLIIMQDEADLSNYFKLLPKMGFDAATIAGLIEFAKKMHTFSPLTMKVNLPGPTGENNFMLFKPRGKVLCLAMTKLDYARQIVCALVTGNQVVFLDTPLSREFAKLSGVEYCDTIASADAINAVMIANNYTNIWQIRQDVAARDGQLVVSVEEKEGFYNLFLLVSERTISINTTATGGNVELMSMKDIVE